MKVATFSLEMTSHSSFLTLRALSGTAIWRLSLTLTWQPRRQPSLICLREKKPVSVGRMVPPPSRTWSLHWPQLALPPQAEEEDAVVREGVHQVTAGGDFQFLGTVVDGHLDGAGGHEGVLDPDQQNGQQDRHDEHHEDGRN